MSQLPRETKEIGADGPHFSTETDSVDSPAWTEIDPGRFMPRRVRGSCHGRALG
jgi:hypothetical protein